MHAKQIAQTVSADLVAWRDATWKRDHGVGSSFRRTSLMTNTAISVISKSTAILNSVADFSKLELAWDRAACYGEEVLNVIAQAREKVFEPYRRYQAQIDKLKKEAEERKQDDKLRKVEKATEDRERKKRKREHENKKRKYTQWLEWREEQDAGVLRPGRKRRKPDTPTPSPETRLPDV
jgi:hypothetical protein